MALFSWQFILFLAVSLAAYYSIPGRYRWLVLLASSAWYYLVGGGPRASVFVAVTVLTTWGGALLMDGVSRREAQKDRAAGKDPETPRKLSREEKKARKALIQKKKSEALH